MQWWKKRLESRIVTLLLLTLSECVQENGHSKLFYNQNISNQNILLSLNWPRRKQAAYHQQLRKDKEMSFTINSSTGQLTLSTKSNQHHQLKIMESTLWKHCTGSEKGWMKVNIISHLGSSSEVSLRWISERTHEVQRGSGVSLRTWR